MAELGLVLVGPAAGALVLDLGEVLPVVRVCVEAIVPLDEDLAAMVGYAVAGTFHGPDADRWKVLDERELRESTDVLWATAQVQSAALAQVASGWDRVLVVGWMDEPGLIPAVRALVPLKRPLTILLGGDTAARAPGIARSNLTVLAELLRTQGVAMVMHNPTPGQVIEVAIDAARSPQSAATARARPVDIGGVLDLPPTWCMPASGVDFYQLVHVPMGHADGLARLAVDIAAWRALHELVHGPPVDVMGAAFGSPEEARARLPQGDVYAHVLGRVRTALSRVRFEGTRLLVEQIDAELRPALEEIRAIRRVVADVERLRLQHLRAFTAVGIQYTVHNLDHRLDGIQDTYPSHLLEEMDELLSGESEITAQGRVHLTAWRYAFSGLPSEIVPRTQPGASVARRLVTERFVLFAGEYGQTMARAVQELVLRAQDPNAAPSTEELRALRDRAARVRETLKDALARLDERINAAAEQAIRDDRFVRWATPHGSQLRQLLASRIASLPIGPALDRAMTEALSRRPLGMADDRDFEGFLKELSVAVHQLPGAFSAQAPSYEAVLLLVLQGRDPPVLRQALAKSAGAEVELHLERPVEPALMNWLTATGMLVVVAPRLRTCAIYWQRAESLSSASLEVARTATTEHRLGDLVLPPPEGDTVGSLVATVRAAGLLLVGLVLGELSVTRREGLAVHELHAPRLESPDPSAPGEKTSARAGGRVLLPHGGLHWLTSDTEAAARLRARVAERIDELPSRPDAGETARKLVELASLGPSPTLAAQLGLFGARFEHLEQPIHALLEAHANHAVAALVDVLSSEALDAIARPPHRRSLLDVQQLGPGGQA